MEKTLQSRCRCVRRESIDRGSRIQLKMAGFGPAAGTARNARRTVCGRGPMAHCVEHVMARSQIGGEAVISIVCAPHGAANERLGGTLDPTRETTSSTSSPSTDIMQCKMQREATGCGGFFDRAIVGPDSSLASAAATTTLGGPRVAAATGFLTKPYQEGHARQASLPLFVVTRSITAPGLTWQRPSADRVGPTGDVLERLRPPGT